MSARAKMRAVTLVFGLIILILGVALIMVPADAWNGYANQKLASIGLDQYGVTIALQLYLQGSSTPLTGNLICGSQVYSALSNPSAACYNAGLVGSPKDPWAVYDLTSTGYPPGTTLLKAHGTLVKNSDHTAVSNVEIDISWYYGTAQASGWNPSDPSKTSFQVFPMTSTSTNSQGVYDSQYFQVPSQANGMKIIWMAEVYKGPYSAQTCDQSSVSSTAYCTAQSEHYLMAVGTLSPTQTGLSVWVGQGCSQSTTPTESSTCFRVWTDGKDNYGANSVSVTLPFTVIAVATVGPDVSAIYVHAKNMAYGSPIEQGCFPAQMRTLSGSYLSSSKKVFALVISSLSTSTDCSTKASTADTGIPTGQYDMEFTSSATPPWVQSSIVLAIIHVNSGSSILGTGWTWPSITLVQGIGGVLAIFGVAVIGTVMIRKHP